jgi:hypothetical protein
LKQENDENKNVPSVFIVAAHLNSTFHQLGRLEVNVCDRERVSERSEIHALQKI